MRGLAFRVAVGAALCAAGPSSAQEREQPGSRSRSIAVELGLPAVSRRDASCNCVEPLPAATSFEAPIEADARWAVSETAALTFFAALGIDLLGSGASGGARTGVIISPQGGVAFDAFVSSRFALGIEARTGIVAVPDAGFRPAVLAGQTSFAMPLDLALRFTLEL